LIERPVTQDGRKVHMDDGRSCKGKARMGADRKWYWHAARPFAGN